MALSVRGLTKEFRRAGPMRRSQETHLAVNNVDFEIRLGEVVGLIGESGSGKTTLIRTALGLIPYTTGEIELLGKQLSNLKVAELRAMRRKVQLLFQSPEAMLNPGLTVREHLLESAALHRPNEDREELAVACAQEVGLDHRLDNLPRQLSGGEKRRVGIARVHISRPQLLVADEPTAGLDAALKADLIDLLLQHRGPENAILLVSHDLPLVTYACDRVLVMLDGRIVDSFQTIDMKNKKHHPYTEQLLRATNMLDEECP
ncbi:MAG: dipeptide/oligopeptide/nickel ABC transporter ATP-binding protein [Myxococcota bacterium]|nr:dipeptide/oligopeptide/nickel ABC transporter ATP-binding protein [Myxococcota bacterium]